MDYLKIKKLSNDLWKISAQWIILALIISTIWACSDNTIEIVNSKNPLQYSSDSPVLFLSTQFNPIDEANKIRRILKESYSGEVDFQPNDNHYIFRKLKSTKNDSAQILIGALHGDLMDLYKKGALAPVTKIINTLSDRDLNQAYSQLAHFDNQGYFYVPWMQATYIMAANKKALPYLPTGADLNTLTYEELLEWGENMKAQTGQTKLGFPMGEKGLIHRFFQGYLYPAFTGSVVNKFASAEANSMWQYFRKLWLTINPHSLSYSSMSEPLLAEEVWVTWDHTARLINAFESEPEKFIAFPAPAGPKGRSYMAVVSGLALPAGQEDSESAKAVLEFMTNPTIQVEIVKQVGFFPTVSGIDYEQLPIHLKEIASAVQLQATSTDAITTLLPAGLGEEGALFNALYTLTFSDIVLGEQDIGKTLSNNADEMNNLFQRTQAPCWQPDKVGNKACAVD